MESRLLFSRLHWEATSLRMQEKFATASASRSALRAELLKPGLRSALDLKRRESMALKDVFQRCKERDCPGNRTCTSYSLAEAVNSEFCRVCFRVGRSIPSFCLGASSSKKPVRRAKVVARDSCWSCPIPVSRLVIYRQSLIGLWKSTTAWFISTTFPNQHLPFLVFLVSIARQAFLPY